MTDFHWARAIDGSFGNDADWSVYGVPGASDTAILDAAGGAFTVTSAFDETVLGVQLAANATLAISGGTFTASAGTNGGANAGQIAITNHARLALGGTFDNKGGISLGGGGASLFIDSSATLTGGGVIRLGYDPLHPAGIGGAAGATLDNQGNTIVGAGRVGDTAGFHLINGAAGVIEADVGNQFLVLGGDQAGVSITNHGVIESASAVGFNRYQLNIDGATMSGSGGRIVAGVYSQVTMMNCDVTGQSLTVQAHGEIALDDSRIRLDQSVDNAFDITLFNSTATVAGAISLVGGGYVVLASGAGQGRVVVTGGPGAILTNVDNRLFMEGSALGRGHLELINEAAGTISGWGVIDGGAQAIVNRGLIEATHPNHFGHFKPLVIASPIDNGGVLAVGGASALIVEGDVTGSGQVTIGQTTFRGGLADFVRAFSQDVTFVPGRARANFSPLETLELAQSQGYAGSITGFSKDGRTALDLGDIAFVSAGEASFSGTTTSGVLTVTDGTHTARITLIGDFVGTTFTAMSDGHGGTTVEGGTNGARAAVLAAHAARLGAGSATLAAAAAADWPPASGTLTAPRAG